MLRCLRCWLVFLLLLLGIVGAAIAQDNPPLILFAHGDFWAWDEVTSVAHPLTTGISHFTPVLSPDGSRVAYTAYPDMVVQALERTGGIGGGPLPKDIWVLDVASGESSLVAAQPADASFFVTGTPDKAVIRSRPAWSPDRTWLAWTEALYPDWTIQLNVYNFQTGDMRTIVTGLPEQGGVPDVLDVLWADSGLVLHSATFADGTTDWQDTFLVYDTAGTLLREIPLPIVPDHALEDFTLVQVNGRDYIGVLDAAGEWAIIDPLSGLTAAVPAPELYNPLYPDTSLVIKIIPRSGDSLDMIQLTDAAGQPLGEPVAAGYLDFTRITIAPDGQAAAYLTYNPADRVFEPYFYVWRDNQVSEFLPPGDSEGVGELVWGPVAWRLAGDTPADFVCPGAAATRLSVGAEGRVTPTGGPNNLRSAPAKSGSLLGEIPENGIFNVIGGPVCDGDLVWWQVDYNGQTGWTAESQGQTYFLQPVN